MDSSKYTEVTIFGEQYKLISTYKDQERIQKVANLVDERMESLSKRFPSYSKAKIAILTSLNLADELFRNYADQNKVNERMDKLLKIVDNSMPDSVKYEA